MKKSIIVSVIFLMVILYTFGIISAAQCDPEISIINQDPYPAIPGDYVKVVFQIDGLENPNCGEITFGIKEDYPIYLDPNIQNPITINSGIYQKNYGSFYLAPYKLRLDENALNGENPIEVYYSTGSSSASNVVKDFNITVEDTRADFEIHVKDYDYNTRILTFEILNVANVNVKLLRLQIPKQDSVEVKGSNWNVVGDLDSNEYTTADFEAIMPTGQSNINLNLIYQDTIGRTRELQKVVNFDSSYFTGREVPKKTPWTLIVIVVVVIAFFVWRRINKKKREKERMKKRGMM